MKAPFSEYLTGIADGLRKLTEMLKNDYEYVSILASDSKGINVRISSHTRNVSENTMASERGIVIRTAKHGQYSEYALNDFDPARTEEFHARIKAAFDEQYALLESCGTKV